MDADTFRSPTSHQSDYIGLDSLIRLTNAPALDPYIVDWQHRGCNEQLAETVYRCMAGIRGRLFNAGFGDYKQGIVAKPNILKCLRSYLNFKTITLKPIRATAVGNDLYILTKRAGGDLFIHPPYNEYGIMSWDEYFLRVIAGQGLRPIIRAPWAQAKIMDIE